MRKFGILAATIFISILLGGVYGMIHDEITYSISPEYFTKFKYPQFGLDEHTFGGHRKTVAAIGFLATWWMGLFIGLLIGFVGLIYRDHVSMRKAISRSVPLVLVVAALFAAIGFLWGKYHLVKTGVGWWMPANLLDKDSFIIVGSIHNFSYLGGLAGLAIAIVYMTKRARRNN